MSGGAQPRSVSAKIGRSYASDGSNRAGLTCAGPNPAASIAAGVSTSVSRKLGSECGPGGGQRLVGARYRQAAQDRLDQRQPGSAGVERALRARGEPAEPGRTGRVRDRQRAHDVGDGRRHERVV